APGARPDTVVRDPRGAGPVDADVEPGLRHDPGDADRAPGHAVDAVPGPVLRPVGAAGLLSARARHLPPRDVDDARDLHFASGGDRGHGAPFRPAARA